MITRQGIITSLHEPEKFILAVVEVSEAFKLRAEIVERCFAHNLDRDASLRCAGMNRNLVIVVALSVFFSIGPLAFEIPSELDSDSSKAKGLILTFEDWPPDGADTDPLLQKLHSAGLKTARKFPRFRVWVFEWDEWHGGPKGGKPVY